MYEALVDIFIKSTTDMFEEMTKINISDVSEPVLNSSNTLSLGVTSIVTFAGLIKGRVILDAQQNLVMKMVEAMLKDDSIPEDEKPAVGGIAEINNVITGDAVTNINNMYKLKLRLAPPNVLIGRHVLSKSDMDSYTITFNTEYGKFRMDVGFEGRFVAS